MTIFTLPQNTPILYIKSNFEYLRGNYRKAIKLLNSAPQSLKTTAETGENLAAMYYNNMGVIHFYMRKHNLGAFYFRKALQENEVCSTEFNKPQYGESSCSVFTLGALVSHILLTCSTIFQGFKILFNPIFLTKSYFVLFFGKCPILSYFLAILPLILVFYSLFITILLENIP